MSELTHKDVFTKDEWLNWNKLTSDIYDIAVGRMTNQGDSVIVEHRADGAYYVSLNFGITAVAINESHALSKANEAALLNGLWIQPEIEQVNDGLEKASGDIVSQAIACGLDITGWIKCVVCGEHIALKRFTDDGEYATLWINKAGDIGHGWGWADSAGIVTGSVPESYIAVNNWAMEHGGWAKPVVTSF